jgi:hypothetical protein
MLEYTEYKKICKECESLSKEKNSFYGSKGLLIFKGLGCLIRIADKIFRIIYIKENNINDKETIEDNLKDIINYAIYYIMIKRNKLIKLEVQ